MGSTAIQIKPQTWIKSEIFTCNTLSLPDGVFFTVIHQATAPPILTLGINLYLLCILAAYSFDRLLDNDYPGSSWSIDQQPAHDRAGAIPKIVIA